MKSAKIHILDQLEEIRLDCQRHPVPYSIHPSEHDLLALKQKNPKKKKNESGFSFERTLTIRRMNSYESTEPTGNGKKQFSLQNYCQTFISTIINDERVDQVVCKILGISYHHLLIQNIATIIRDRNCSSSVISHIFDPNHIKLTNPAKLYSALESQFEATRSTTLSLKKSRSRTFSLMKLKHFESKRTMPPGLVILLHPSTTTSQHKFQLRLRYRSSVTKQICNDSLVFWGNGNLYSNHMTTIHNLPQWYLEERHRLSAICVGGDPQEHLRNSLPGYNGRIPIWLPCYEVEVTLEEYSLDEQESDLPETEFTQQCLTPINTTKINKEPFFFENDIFESTPQNSSSEKKLLRLYTSHSYNSLLPGDFSTGPTHLHRQHSTLSTSRSPFEHSRSSPLLFTPYINPSLTPSHYLALPTGTTPPPSPYRPIQLLTPTAADEFVIHFKYFACSSLEKTLDQLAAVTQHCQRQSIASLTLPGSVPALNAACLYGNVHVRLNPLPRLPSTSLSLDCRLWRNSSSMARISIGSVAAPTRHPSTMQSLAAIVRLSNYSSQRVLFKY
jgi:hypothetical protein